MHYIYSIHVIKNENKTKIIISPITNKQKPIVVSDFTHKTHDFEEHVLERDVTIMAKKLYLHKRFLLTYDDDQKI